MYAYRENSTRKSQKWNGPTESREWVARTRIQRRLLIGCARNERAFGFLRLVTLLLDQRVCCLNRAKHFTYAPEYRIRADLVYVIRRECSKLQLWIKTRSTPSPRDELVSDGYSSLWYFMGDLRSLSRFNRALCRLIRSSLVLRRSTSRTQCLSSVYCVLSNSVRPD